MHGDSGQESAALVAVCTAAAAHRRDHHHRVDASCHPHAVEVVGLGRRAVAVCHDCQSDTGFLSQREAEALAQLHRSQTLGDGNPPLCPAA